MSDYKTNDTLNNVIDLFNISNVNKSELFDFYEAHRSKEKEQLMAYKNVAYILGTLIILSNVIVVVSSGLILKKGQQPKSTYLLLGNVSLADTIVGISIIFSVTVDSSISSTPMCVFQTGMLVCPAMVSIFSVALIAIDRYIYILHGLYYQRWFNTTRVRIGILFIWMIGITLGFLPATGWTNKELILTRCYYVSLFPGELILLNSFLSIIPIVVVAVLYTIILIKALKTVKNLNGTIKIKEPTKDNHLRMYRGTAMDKKNFTQSVKMPAKCDNKICRSSSFDEGIQIKGNKLKNRAVKSKSTDDLVNNQTYISLDNGRRNVAGKTSKIRQESEISICTIESASVRNSITDLKKPSNSANGSRTTINGRKTKEPNKWRAITIVMLTSGSFMLTWLPFFVIVIFFVFCEDKLTNPKCTYLRTLLGGPIATLAFLNSILNPLIYAWWHRGFQRSVKSYYRRYLHKYICHIVR